MTDAPSANPRPTGRSPSPFEMLLDRQRVDVAKLVAGAVKRGDVTLADFERICNDLATVMLKDATVDPAQLLITMLPSQHELRERIEDIAAQAMSAELHPDREPVAQAQRKLMQLPTEDRQKIEAAIDKRVKDEKAPGSRRMTVMARVLAKEKLLVALMNDKAAVEEILAQPPREVEGRRPR